MLSSFVGGFIFPCFFQSSTGPGWFSPTPNLCLISCITVNFANHNLLRLCIIEFFDKPSNHVGSLTWNACSGPSLLPFSLSWPKCKDQSIPLRFNSNLTLCMLMNWLHIEQNIKTRTSCFELLKGILGEQRVGTNKRVEKFFERIGYSPARVGRPPKP